jgi:hypothetical protein
LFAYDDPEDQRKYGKSQGGDITSGTLLKLLPGFLVKQSVEFQSDDPSFFRDHLAGINSTLENLADYLRKI